MTPMKADGNVSSQPCGATMAANSSNVSVAGVEALRNQVSVLIIVDVLSFLPLGDRQTAEQAALQVGAELALPRKAAGGQFRLSPISLNAIAPGTRLMLPSPNGSRLSLACGATPVLTACLRNAAAVAAAARNIAGDRAVGVIPAGERWPDGSLRPAIEDLLGAGAVIHHLGLSCLPEARIARDAFRSAGDELTRLVRGSVSGLEPADSGFVGDVDIALDIGVSGCAPILKDGAHTAR